jgi:hypothetical protein
LLKPWKVLFLEPMLMLITLYTSVSRPRRFET